MCKILEYLDNIDENNLDNIALVEGRDRYTYRQYISYSNQIANYLNSLDVRRGDRIAVIHKRKSAQAFFLMLGIMKTGAIYVPINSILTKSKIEEIIDDSNPKYIIADYEYNEKNTGFVISNKEERIAVNLWDDIARKYSNIYRNNDVIDNDVAYIIYTSGSTGKPKGVMITYNNLLPVIKWRTEAFAMNERSQMLSTAPMYFDPIFLEVFCCILSRGTLFIYDKNLQSIKTMLTIIRKEKITIFICVPSLIRMILVLKKNLNIEDYSSVKTIVVGGSVISIASIREASQLFVNADFFNGYGLTETSISASLHKIELDQEIEIPLGKPMPGSEFYVINEENEIADIGETGELVIRGPHIMQGYWNKEEETNKVLKQNPIYTFLNEKVLYSGDLVRISNKNQYIYCGRKDEQIKILGYRIELGDLDNTILKMEFIDEAYTVCISDQMDKVLVSFLKVNRVTVSVDMIKKKMALILPKYMIPKEIIICNEFPKLGNGKIDKMMLKKMAEEYVHGKRKDY